MLIRMQVGRRKQGHVIKLLRCRCSAPRRLLANLEANQSATKHLQTDFYNAECLSPKRNAECTKMHTKIPNMLGDHKFGHFSIW